MTTARTLITFALCAVLSTGCVVTVGGSPVQTHYIVGIGRVRVETRDPVTAIDVKAFGATASTAPNAAVTVGYSHKTSVMIDEHTVADVTLSEGRATIRTANLGNGEDCNAD